MEMRRPSCRQLDKYNPLCFAEPLARKLTLGKTQRRRDRISCARACIAVRITFCQRAGEKVALFYARSPKINTLETIIHTSPFCARGAEREGRKKLRGCVQVSSLLRETNEM